MKSEFGRYSLLRQAFCDIPSQIGTLTLRPLSGGSFELLSEIESPLVDQEKAPQGMPQLVAAITEYIWIHSAPIERVSAIRSRSDLPSDEIRGMALEIPIGEALAFATSFSLAARRMAAAVAEVVPEDEDTPGKPMPPPIGSPRLSSPAELPEIPSGSETYSGSLPSSELSPTFTQQTPRTEPGADGFTPSMIPPPIIFPNPET